MIVKGCGKLGKKEDVNVFGKSIASTAPYFGFWVKLKVKRSHFISSKSRSECSI